MPVVSCLTNQGRTQRTQASMSLAARSWSISCFEKGCAYHRFFSLFDRKVNSNVSPKFESNPTCKYWRKIWRVRTEQHWLPVHIPVRRQFGSESLYCTYVSTFQPAKTKYDGLCNNCTYIVYTRVDHFALIIRPIDRSSAGWTTKQKKLSIIPIFINVFN